MKTIEKARTEYSELCRTFGTDKIDEENAILSVGREFLPACAIAVLDGGEATVEYYEWLTLQTQSAQNEHDLEVAAGHEWHEP